ncbi:hypothetical protein ACPV5G_21105, partial [Photobacterium damselae]|uniref:hypothetical protein n=1 Tax=Photobacterium damselae TaxID=38293 RepID=UPI00406969B7
QTDTSPSVNNDPQPYSPSLREVMGVYNQVQSGNYELTDKGIAPRNLDVTAGDVFKSVGVGALDLVSGLGEASEQLTGYGAGLRDLAGSASSAIKDSMTDDGQLALQRSIVSEDENGRLSVGDGAGDIDVWAMKFANSAGSMLPGVLAGGGAGLAARATVGGLVRSTMLKRGASQLIADKVANKTVEYIAKGAASGALTGGSVGSAALGAKEQLQSLGAGWL